MLDRFVKDGKLTEVGQLVILNRMSSSLASLLADGVDDLYTGAKASELVSYLTSLGSVVSLNDMKTYRVETRKPIPVSFKGVVSLHSHMFFLNFLMLNICFILQEEKF